MNTAEYAAAQKDLGNMYHNGWGVDKDEEMAQSFYKKAWDAYKTLADNGDIEAQFELVKLSRNFDVTKWIAKNVFKHYKSQTDNGDVKAKIRLGLMYAQGLGVEKNLDAAKKIIESIKENIKITLRLCNFLKLLQNPTTLRIVRSWLRCTAIKILLPMLTKIF